VWHSVAFKVSFWPWDDSLRHEDWMGDRFDRGVRIELAILFKWQHIKHFELRIVTDCCGLTAAHTRETCDRILLNTLRLADEL